MKKESIRSLLAGLVIMTSIAAYTFINTVTVPQQCKSDLKIESYKECVKSAEEAILPDVRIIKKLMEKSVSLIPKS